MPNRNRIILVAAAALVVAAGAYSVLRPTPQAPVLEAESEAVVAPADARAAMDFAWDADADYGLRIAVAGEGANGEIVIDLDEEAAPGHARRIAELAAARAYDNVVFHRVIDGFMAQTGDVEFGRLGADMRMAGRGGSDQPDLKAEFSDLSFEKGVVGMARSQSPDSANSQFFIMFAPASHLNGQYTVVGRVTEGLDVLDAIKRGTGPNGAVVGAPDVMLSVDVVETK